MAVIQSVREFGRELTSRCGAPAGTIETYIEVPFENGKFRPDGLIRVTRGKTEWTALVEVKTGRIDLRAEQVENYVDIARNQGFDAVITIGHEVATTPGVHPVVVDKRKLHRVALFHLSWSRIHTEALIQQSAHTVSDPDQAWILSEFIRYLEEKKSGALDFEDMGPYWTKVRDACPLGTLRAGDPETLDVVSRFDQLVAFCGMELSRQLGVHVQQGLSRKERSDHPSRIQAQRVLLAKTGQLQGSLLVPNAAAPLTVTVDLRAAQVHCSLTLGAPMDRRVSARVNWLERQLRDAPPALRVVAAAARVRDTGPSRSLAEIRVDPSVLIDPPQADIRSFTVTLSQPIGRKRGQGDGSFVRSVAKLVDTFYAEVLQRLKPWSAPAPKLKGAMGEAISAAGDGTSSGVTKSDDAVGDSDSMPIRPGMAIQPATDGPS